jgi:hypothetical protein
MAVLNVFRGIRTNPNAPTTAAGFRALNRPSQVSVKPGTKVALAASPDREKVIADLREENRVLREQCRVQGEKLKTAEGKLSALASDLAPPSTAAAPPTE